MIGVTACVHRSANGAQRDRRPIRVYGGELGNVVRERTGVDVGRVGEHVIQVVEDRRAQRVVLPAGGVSDHRAATPRTPW